MINTTSKSVTRWVAVKHLPVYLSSCSDVNLIKRICCWLFSAFRLWWLRLPHPVFSKMHHHMLSTSIPVSHIQGLNGSFVINSKSLSCKTDQNQGNAEGRVMGKNSPGKEMDSVMTLEYVWREMARVNHRDKSYRSGTLRLRLVDPSVSLVNCSQTPGKNTNV